MSETGLKFGPEWLRALSHGGSGNNLSSPPPSPGLNKFKLAEYRYGREEMLALFNKHHPPPEGIAALGSLLVEMPQEPLAFIPINEEEQVSMLQPGQRMWQRGVNSDAVIRLSGRTAANGGGRGGRGGSVDRGRGRGRGTSSYYSRGLSYEDETEPRGVREGGPPGMGMSRGKPFERSQSVHEQRGWGERGPGVPPMEDRNGAISPRKEQGRASTENWRSRGGEGNATTATNTTEEADRWRGLGSTAGRSNEKWGTRGGWRERENGVEGGEWEEVGSVGGGRGRGGAPGGPRRPPWDGSGHNPNDPKELQLRRPWEENHLPEWAMDNEVERGGSFDAAGAFHGPGWTDEDDPNDNRSAAGIQSQDGRPIQSRPRQKSGSPDKPITTQEMQTQKQPISRPESQRGGGPDDQELKKNGDIDDRGLTLNKQGLPSQPSAINVPKSSIPNDPGDSKASPPGGSNGTGESSSPGPSTSESVSSSPSPAPPLVNGVTVSPHDNTHGPGGQHGPQGTPPPRGSSPQQPSEISGPSLERPQPQTSDPHGTPSPTVSTHHFQSPHPPSQHSQNSHIQTGEEERLNHMHSVANSLVAQLVEEDDPGVATPIGQAPPPPGPSGNLQDPPSQQQSQQQIPGDDKWYYTDPQGHVQGAFSSSDMAEWYKAGYFTPNLLLKRECDDKFAQLGDLTRVFGRVPFIPGPPVPPLKVTELLNAQKAQAERERMELMQNYMIQKQLYQQQCQIGRQQVLQKLQAMDEWSTLNPMQQQQLFMQQLMAVLPMAPPVPPSLPPQSSATTPPPQPPQQPIPPPTSIINPTPVIPVSTPQQQQQQTPVASPPQDPIQAFMQQMKTTSSNSSSSGGVAVSSSEGLMTSGMQPVGQQQQPAPVSPPENPLQKLILQLQQGQQQGGSRSGGLGGGQTAVVGGPIAGMNNSGMPPVEKVVQGPGNHHHHPPQQQPPPQQQQPQQFDAIQSLMQQLTKIQNAPSHEQLQEEQRKREEEQKRLEEERRRLEEQKRAEEERIKMEEQRLKEEVARQEETRRKLDALRRQQEEEAQRLEEERRKIHEDQLRRQEEAIRLEQEKRKKEEEMKRQWALRMEEEKRKEEEERMRKVKEAVAQEQQRLQQEAHLRQEELRRQQMAQQQQQHQQQQQQQQQQALLLQQQQQQAAIKQAEEEAAAKREAKRQEELRRLQEEERRRQEEEQKIRMEKESEEARQQAQIEEEMRRIALEEERRHMLELEEEERRRAVAEEEERQQAALQERLKQMMPAWNTVPAPVPEAGQPAPSLADIQRAQEEKERLEREKQEQLEAQRQREAQAAQAEEQKQKKAGLKWAAPRAVAAPAPAQPVKSLLEIQAEEEKELKKVKGLKKRQEKEATERAAAVSHLSIGAAGVWGSHVQNLSWAGRASSNLPPASEQPMSPPSSKSSQQQQSQQQWGGDANSNSSSGGGTIWSTSSPSSNAPAPSSATVWNNDHTSIWNNADNSNSMGGGFWDNPEAVKNLKPSSGSSNKAASQQPVGRNAKSNKANTPPQNKNSNNNNKVNKKKGKDDSETVKKLFSENMTPADNFTTWCKTALNTLKVHASIDIPTFVTFLAEVESPYEVHDYIRSYLGDAKEVKEFARQYLERRSKARNAQKEREYEDDILAPAPAINPQTGDFQEIKTKNKKGSKKKMQKVDSSILGFNVTSAERINVGERDFVE